MADGVRVCVCVCVCVLIFITYSRPQGKSNAIDSLSQESDQTSTGWIKWGEGRTEHLTSHLTSMELALNRLT